MEFIKNHKLDFRGIINNFFSISAFWILCRIATMIISININSRFCYYLKILFGFDKEVGLYSIFYRIYEGYKYGSGVLWLIFVVVIIFALFILFICLKSYIKEKLLLIEHYSLNETNFKYDKGDIEKFIVKEYAINQYLIVNNNLLCIQEKVKKIISSVEDSVDEIKQYIKKGYNIGYSGIANIPSTFMLGYEIGDENYRFLFHKRRDIPDNDTFNLLKNDPKTEKIRLIEDIPNDSTKEGKLFLVISISKEIREEDIIILQEENDYIIKYKTNNIDYDIIESSYQAYNYANKIIEEITPIEKQANIKQIKLCIAAPSAFIFALGTKFSKTQDKEIVVYNFDKGKYAWGINVTKKRPIIV